MKESVIRYFSILIKLCCPFISMIFTFKLMMEIIGFSSLDQKIIVIIISAILNIIELLVFYYWKKYGAMHDLVFGLFLAAISVLGSLGYLQIGYERAIIQSKEYQLKLDEIEKLKRQIDLMSNAAERQQQLNYISRSKQTLIEMTGLMNKLGILQRELSKIKEQGYGFGGAIYRILMKLFNLNNFTVAVLFNLALAILIEFAAIKFNIMDVKSEFPKPNANSLAIASKQSIAQQNPSAQSIQNVRAMNIIDPKKYNDFLGSASKKASIISIAHGNNYSEIKEADIARMVGCSRQYVHQVLLQDKEKTKNANIGFSVSK